MLQAEKHYEIISGMYPNGKVPNETWGDVPAWWYYYAWINDRGANGLGNTHLQYVGVTPKELWKLMTSYPDNFPRYIEHLNAVDQFLTKTWKYSDLMKFAMGYERWNDAPNMIEIHTINYTIPQILRAFGFPATFIRIDPNPIGTADYEWVVSLPNYVAEKLKMEFGDKIIIGPGNTFGLYLCREGLLKDGVKEISVYIAGSYLYKSKAGTIELA